LSSIRDIARQLSERAAQKEKGNFAPKEPVVYASMALERPATEDALRALAQNVISEDNLGIEGARVQVVARPDTLKANCIFIKQAYVFLGLLDCPGDARDIILWLAGHSEGDFSRPFTLTQAQIAESMGLSVDTVQRKLKALEAWEQQTNRTVIQIIKQPYDYKAKKYGVTEYRVLASKYILEYANRAKGLRFQDRTSSELLEAAIEQGHREMAEEIADDMPLAPVIPRNQKKHQPEKNITPEQVTYNRGERVYKQIMSGAHEWFEIGHQKGLTVAECTAQLQKGLQRIIDKYAQAYPD